MGVVLRRQWLKVVIAWPASQILRAMRKEFWENKDPGDWTEDEKETLLYQSPWARPGNVALATDKNRRKTLGYGKSGKLGGDMPDMRQAAPPGTVTSVPIGEPIPPVPNPDPGHPLQFPALARWETAKPVRLAGGPEVPELTGEFYVIRLRGLPLMPPPKDKPTADAPNPNEGMLLAIKQGSRLERKNKPPILCAHLFTGSGDTATEVLLFFPRTPDPITLADKSVTLESRFASFQLSIAFPLKEMVYKGELSL